MFVTETSDAINTGMATQNEGRRLAQSASLRPQLDLWLFGWYRVTLASIFIFLTSTRYFGAFGHVVTQALYLVEVVIFVQIHASLFYQL